jgi:glycosyltransferase involved in cell wall biosynthesis
LNILHIYPDTCEYAYPNFSKEELQSDVFDKQIIAQTDLEVRYLSGLKALGEDCIFLYPRLYKLPIKEFIHKGGYRIIRFPITFSIGSVNYPLGMLKYIRRVKPDLIHFHNIYGGGKYFYIRFFNLVTLYSKILRIPVYGWYHTGSLTPIPKIKALSEKYNLFRKMDHYLRTWVFNRCRGITSINHPELNRLFNRNNPEYYGFHMHTKHRLVTPNTFNKDVFHPISKKDAILKLGLDPSKKYMIMISRLFESKGLHDIIEVIPKIIERLPEFHLLVVGDYIERAAAYKIKINSQIEKLDVSNYITFLGRIEHHQGINLYINASEAHILPTYKESFGAVNLEALACKIPVITTNIEEMPYYIKEGLGIMIEPGDQLALRNAIIKILEREFQWNEDQYLELVEKYEYRNAAATLLAWYKKTLSN